MKEFEELEMALEDLLGEGRAARFHSGVEMKGTVGDLVDAEIFQGVWEPLIDKAASDFAKSAGWDGPVTGPAYDEFYRSLDGARQGELDRAIGEIYDRPFECVIRRLEERDGKESYAVWLGVADGLGGQAARSWDFEAVAGNSAREIIEALKSPDAFAMPASAGLDGGELAEALNGAIMEGGDIGRIESDAMLLESRWLGPDGRMAGLLFIPIDRDTEGMAPIERLAQDILDCYGLAEGDDREEAELAANMARNSTLGRLAWGIQMDGMPGGMQWRGKLVHADEALSDFREYRKGNRPENRPAPR